MVIGFIILINFIGIITNVHNNLGVIFTVKKNYLHFLFYVLYSKRHLCKQAYSVSFPHVAARTLVFQHLLNEYLNVSSKGQNRFRSLVTISVILHENNTHILIHSYNIFPHVPETN